jgi:SAM-dependent methyltransferase
VVDVFKMPAPRPWPPSLLRAVRPLSRELIVGARGRVLDLGMDLGHLSDFKSSAADELVVLEPNEIAAKRLCSAADRFELPVEIRRESLAGLDSGREQFDTVVSVFALPFQPDLELTLRALKQLLRPDGRVLFLEPVGSWTRMDRLLRGPGHLLRSTAGLHLERDVPRALRSVGLSVIDVKRVEVPTMIWPLRHVVQGRAWITLDEPDENRQGEDAS